MSREPYAVVIADDSEVDRFFLKRAIKDGAPGLRVVSELETGDEVMAYLAGEGRFANRQEHPLPDLLLLDMRMPRGGGIEVLQWLKTRPPRDFMVAVLADTSGTERRELALELGANYFFSKIAHSDELIKVVQRLQADLEQDRQS